MKRVILAVAALAASAAIATPALAQHSADAPVKTAGTLTVGLSLPSPGFQTGTVRGTNVTSPKGMEVEMAQLIAKKLAPADPPNDGKQTPYRNHPVFVAQHATATCCRGCLERNHQIARGQELTADERRCVTAVIMRWIEREVPDAPQ